MPGPSLLTAAVEELYAAPLAEFTARRKTLATAARKAGDRGAATAIGALRKPTLSADTVNRLVRGAPDEVDELLMLGAALRRAEQALDAAELRRLGERRRKLVNDLAELAFELTGQTNPSASVRDEVSATLNASLADEEVAQRLTSGALVTQARWDGFGSTQLPELAASMPNLPPTRPRPAKPSSRPDQPDGGQPAAAATTQQATTQQVTTAPSPTVKEKAAAQAAATRAAQQQADEQKASEKKAAAKRAEEQRASAKQEAARQAVAAQAAEAAAEAAERAAEAQELVSTIDRRVSELNLQLAHQRRLLADAQRALRAAEHERRATALAATRAGAPIG